MKKVYLFVGVIITVFAVVLNFSMGLRSEPLSALTLANIEALARNESASSGTCYKTFTYSGQSVGLVCPDGSTSSKPCPNVSTNGVYGDTYPCMK